MAGNNSHDSKHSSCKIRLNINKKKAVSTEIIVEKKIQETTEIDCSPIDPTTYQQKSLHRYSCRFLSIGIWSFWDINRRFYGKWHHHESRIEIIFFKLKQSIYWLQILTFYYVDTSTCPPSTAICIKRCYTLHKCLWIVGGHLNPYFREKNNNEKPRQCLNLYPVNRKAISVGFKCMWKKKKRYL